MPSFGQSLMARGIGGVQIPFDANFDWPVAKYPVNVFRDRRGTFSTDYDGKQALSSIKAIFDGVAATTTGVYYVDIAKADDTGNGLTMATAKKSIRAARDLAEADGTKTALIIYVKAGFYPIDHNFNGGTPTFPSKPTAVIAVNGRAVVTTAVKNITWALDGADTSNRTYNVTRSNTRWVLNRLAQDTHGDFAKFTRLASAALVQTSVGINAYFWDTGTNLLTAKRADGLPISFENTAVLLGNEAMRTKTVSLYLSGVDVYGGVTGSLQCNDGGTFDVMAEDCTFHCNGYDYESPSATTQVNSITADFKGLLLLNRCGWSKSGGDGLNLHGFTVNAGDIALGNRMFGLAINCRGRDIGAPAIASCNHLTVHGTDDASGGTFEAACRMIAINPDMAGSSGGMVAFGGANQVALFGGTLDGDRGDAFANIASLAIGHSGTSKFFGYEVISRNNEISLKTEGNAIDYLRGFQPTGGRVTSLNNAQMIAI